MQTPFSHKPLSLCFAFVNNRTLKQLECAIDTLHNSVCLFESVWFSSRTNPVLVSGPLVGRGEGVGGGAQPTAATSSSRRFSRIRCVISKTSDRFASRVARPVLKPQGREPSCATLLRKHEVMWTSSSAPSGATKGCMMDDEQSQGFFLSFFFNAPVESVNCLRRWNCWLDSLFLLPPLIVLPGYSEHL